MTAFIFIIFAAAAASGFFMITKLEKLRSEIKPHSNFCLRIAADDASAAASICDKLERLSGKYPDMQFCFFTGTAEEVISALESGNTDIGIISVSPPDNKFQTASVSLKRGQLSLPQYSIVIDPLFEGNADFTIIYCVQSLDDMKNEALDILISSEK